MSHSMKQMVFGGVLVLFGFVTMNAVGTFLTAMMEPIPVGRAGGTAWQVYVLSIIIGFGLALTGVVMAYRGYKRTD